MWNKLPELLINGASLYLVGKELAENHAAKSQWQSKYELQLMENAQLREEARMSRDEIRAVNVQFLDLVKNTRDLEEIANEAQRHYFSLVDQIEALGFRVTEVNEVIVPEEDAELNVVADILEDDEED